MKCKDSNTSAERNSRRGTEVPRIRSVRIRYNGRSVMFDKFIDSLLKVYLSRTKMCISETYTSEDTVKELLASA